MMKKILFSIIALATVLSAVAGKKEQSDSQGKEDGVVEDYNRSSLYTFSIFNPGTEMAENIFSTLLKVQHPDRFNDHNLSLRVLSSKGNPKPDELKDQIADFLDRNKIAQRLVSKWFNRDKTDGSFDMELIKERGNYNASVEDVNMALQTVRGKAMLEDAGEQLIGNTFVIVNDVSYVNKQARAEGVRAFFEALTMIGGAVAAANGGKNNTIKSIGQTGDAISKLVAGFTVHIRSYLFRLVWNDSIASTFYTQCYYDKDHADATKRKAYALNSKLFRLEYVGNYEATSGKTVLRGLHKDEEVFLKVLTRALDKNIVELRKKFEIFKITAPIFEIAADGTLHIHIGLKEGVEPTSKYEVLERREDEEGRITYHRKGIIRPVKDRIWDNRCMATEEQADGAGLGFTTFEKVSGSDFYPGMLVREIR